MSRGPQKFKKRDVTRTLQAVRAAGEKVVRVEIEGCKIVVVVGEPGKTETVTPLDQWMARHADQAEGD
jgi:hypothetical protein